MKSSWRVSCSWQSPVHRGAQPETDAPQVLTGEFRMEDVHQASLQRQAPLEMGVEAALEIERVSLVAGEHPAALRVQPDLRSIQVRRRQVVRVIRAEEDRVQGLRRLVL